MIQLDEGRNPDKTTAWVCDVVVADFRHQTVWLCEVTYENGLYRLVKRLMAWRANWDKVRFALHRDCGFTRGLASEALGLRPAERRIQATEEVERSRGEDNAARGDYALDLSRLG